MTEFQPRETTKTAEAAFKTLETILIQRRTQRNFLQKQTNVFTDSLFGALQAVVLECRDKGLVELGEPRLIDHPAGGGRRALQISIEDWTVIFVPLTGTAWPNARDEAQIPGAAFKELCGRIGVFIGSEPDSAAFYDFLILPNGSWFAWGYGWPRQASTIEETDFKMLAYELLASFVRDIHTTWRTREQTVLGAAMDARRRAYVFGLPGDE
ncbi:MAG TPA: hypothetical protein VHO69_11070 [Phototrophicaceae bacterium]|nr:hypothetical protein [Phototrophicaceae bacterium]